MKAVLFSIGTRGDIEPFLAIGELLKDRGWEVICVFPEQFRKTVEDMSIKFMGFSKEFLELLEAREAKLFLGGKASLFKRGGALVKMARAGIRLSKDIIALQHSIQVKEEPDRIIYHPKCNYAIIWGMLNPGKSIMVSPLPGMIHPTDHIAVLGANYGRLLNRLSFWFVNSMTAIVIKRMSRRYAKDYGDLKITVSSIKKAMLKKEKSLYAISPSLFPPPQHWHSQVNVVGYYERNKTGNWSPDEALLQFVSRHRRILLITFGSMSNPEPLKKTLIICEVLKRNSIAAIINTSWGGLEKIPGCADHIYFTDNIPYDWLFPHLFAVVHHGGSGTTHTAVKYACPSLIIPHALDQFFWAKTIAALQLGPQYLPVRNFNEKDFESKLLDLLSNETYKLNAVKLSGNMKTESNVDKLYEMITT